MKSRINEIENLRIQSGLHTLGIENGKLTLHNRPTRRKCGLYWIHTSYSLEDLRGSTISQNLNAVNIPYLANCRMDLNNVIKPLDVADFWIVYNGIGGGKEDAEYDLGTRILQEFRDNQKTGSLKIMGTSLNDLTKWRFSYVELDYLEYEENRKELETGWRLEYG